MNETWLHSSALSLQYLHSATHQPTIYLTELCTLHQHVSISLVP